MENIKETDHIKWLFLDLNSFFASIEQQENPRLRNNPIAVTPMNTDTTCVIAASYEAKAYGIKTGTPVWEAKKLCPSLICVTAKHKIYTIYHHKIISEIAKHTPINKIWSIDELSSKLPPNKRNKESAINLANRIRQGLWDNIGKSISCSIGFAPNSYLAKIATNLEKPNGLTFLNQSNFHEKTSNLELTNLVGINTNLERRLNYAGIWSIKDFYNLQPKQAKQIWGSIDGEKMWYNLHGHEVSDIKTKRSLIGHSRVLPPSLRNIQQAKIIARKLTTKAASRLRREEYYAGGINLSIKNVKKQKSSLYSRICPSQDNFIFLKEIENMWHKAISNLGTNQIIKVSISFDKLCKKEEITPDLFTTTDPKQQNKTNLSIIMDKLNQKYGSGTIMIGKEPDKDNYETKIAFSRIPEIEEFRE